MPLDPLVVHPLPPARSFAGREAELAGMRDFWNSTDGVLSIVGIGGAGKTALAERFLGWLQENDPPDGLMVWSFYDDTDANYYLKTAYSYITGGTEADAKGTGWFHLLRSQIGDGRKLLFILDGLERVQRPHTDASGIYGELEDPLLKGFLVRLAAGAGNAKAIITSRFPVSSVESFAGKGFRSLQVEYLPLEAARALFAQRGITLGEADGWIMSEYGSHALTLDLLAGYCAGYLGGDLTKLPKVQLDPGNGSDAEQRLGHVLELIRRSLTSRQLDLLSRLCVFRFGVLVEQLRSIFVGEGKEGVGGSLAGATEEDLQADLTLLQSLHIVHSEADHRFTIHPAIRDHFYRLFRDASAAHRAVQEHLSSLAGRPGVGYPSEKEALDLLEELIYHALNSEAIDHAYEVYQYRMGGSEHLNNHLGDYIRTYRILKSFPECPDKTGMYHCLRAFGRFGEALEWRPKNRYILLLEGELADLRNETGSVARSFSRYLMGEDCMIPERSPDVPITTAMLYLLAGNVGEARRIAVDEIQASLYPDDIVRNRMAVAEVMRLEGRQAEAEKLLDEAADWVLSSGSVEHLVYLQLFRGRLYRDQHKTSAAKSAIGEGVVAAREARFRIPLVHLLLEQAVLEPEHGSELAEQALELAESISFAWGVRDARKALAKLANPREPRPAPPPARPTARS